MNAQQAKKALTRARQICAEKGVRLTEKREQVLALMLNAKAPLSAYDVVEQYRTLHGEAIPAMSAYRMLNFLREAGFVHRLETTNQFVACSHIACDHPHEVPQFLICDRCHGVEEIGVKTSILDELLASVQSSGFTLASQQLELHGLCARCRQSAA